MYREPGGQVMSRPNVIKISDSLWSYSKNNSIELFLYNTTRQMVYICLKLVYNDADLIYFIYKVCGRPWFQIAWKGTTQSYRQKFPLDEFSTSGGDFCSFAIKNLRQIKIAFVKFTWYPYTLLAFCEIATFAVIISQKLYKSNLDQISCKIKS